jgi:hypothetical protein
VSGLMLPQQREQAFQIVAHDTVDVDQVGVDI